MPDPRKAYKRDRRHEHRQRGRDLFNNKCSRCGATDRKLVFVRINEDPDVGSMAHAWCKRWDEILLELVEHELLCIRCHRKKMNT